MIKEIRMKAHIFIFKLFFTVFNFMLHKEKTVFVTSYADNSLYVMEALKQKVPTEEIIILKDTTCTLSQKLYPETKILAFNDIKHPIQFIQSIYHLATSRIIFIDNYFNFIAGIPQNKQQFIIQLWHANGTIKKIGMENRQIKSHTHAARDRFQYAYDQIDYHVIGSERMGDIFISAFKTTENKLLKTGVPRTDFFFNELELQRIKKNIEATYPFIKNKKVVLYAPTMRDDTHIEDVMIDFEKLKQSISNDFIILLKYHPRLENVFIADSLPEFVYDVSNYHHVNELLTVVDILITDYSSLPFEFALLRRPMIFYVPDLASYSVSPGLWEPLEASLPGAITKNTDELIEAINHASINPKALNDFNLRWNTYSVGRSSHQLIDVFYH